MTPELRTRWLDTALENQPAEVKARVLDLLLRYGIDPDNEFFMIFTALGQLQVLVEDSPQDWQTLFSSFEAELNAWTQTHLQTLEALSQKAETTERLAGTSKELGNILLTLVQSCNALMQRLATSDQQLLHSSNNWSHSLKSLGDRLNQIEQQTTNHQAVTSSVLSRLEHLKPWSRNWSAKAAFGLTLVSITIFGYQQYQLSQTTNRMQRSLAKTEQHSEWLLQKANRRDCRQGLLPPTGSICRSFR